MKILFTTHWYPTESNFIGGFVQKQYLALSSEQEVDLLHINIRGGEHLLKRSISKITNEDGNVQYEVSIVSFFWKWIYLFYPIQKLLVWLYVKRKIDLDKYDIIHSNIGHPNSAMAYYYSKLYNMPLVISEHHHKVSRYLKKLITKQTLKKAFSNATLIYVSTVIKKAVEKEVKPKKSLIVGNIIDAHKFYHIDRERTGESLKLLVISNWQKSKNNPKRPDLLIHALKELTKEIDLQIIVYHMGKNNLSMTNHIKEEFKNNTHVKFEFLGIVNDTNFVNEKLNQVDFLVHPTDFETFCMVGVEAQKAGTPVVVSDISPINEILCTEGAIFTENSLEEWTRALREALNTSFDRKMIASLMKDKFNADDITTQITEVYKNLLE